MLFVTGGAGFIGSNFILSSLGISDEPILNLDKLTYAGNLHNLDALRGDARHVFLRGDICERVLVRQALERHRPRAIVHFAAESHVDRSILGPAEFIRHQHRRHLEPAGGSARLLGGAAGRGARRLPLSSTSRPTRCTAASALPTRRSAKPRPTRRTAPTRLQGRFRSPGARLPSHLRPAVPDGNCSNNYGPYQFPEKLIPLVIRNALAGEPLPVYGDGLQVRDWLYVLDHCEALRRILARGRSGHTYNIGGGERAQEHRRRCARSARPSTGAARKAAGSYDRADRRS
jgi:dTDP-glucose 4,6-dehydratase